MVWTFPNLHKGPGVGQSNDSKIEEMRIDATGLASPRCLYPSTPQSPHFPTRLRVQRTENRRPHHHQHDEKRPSSIPVPDQQPVYSRNSTTL